MKKYSVIVLSILLIGCSSNPKITEVGPGVIVSEKQLLTKEQIKNKTLRMMFLQVQVLALVLVPLLELALELLAEQC